MSATTTKNRPKAATDAFDTLVGAVEGNILTYFTQTEPMMLGSIAETPQAFQTEMEAYLSICDQVTAAETAATKLKASKVAAALVLKPKLKAFHLLALAAFEANPEVLAKLGFNPPKTRAKPTPDQRTASLQKRRAKAAAKKASNAELAVTLTAIDQGTDVPASTPVGTPAAAPAETGAAPAAPPAASTSHS